MESSNQTNPEREILPALALLGPIAEKFVTISDLSEPLDDGQSNHVYISKSYDASSHFETVYHDVVDMYKRITGKDLVLKPRPVNEEEQSRPAYFS